MLTLTNTTLLEGLVDRRNAHVWSDFCARYQPVVLAFARRLGMREHDAQDAAQETLLAFAEAYRDGKYDRSKGRLRSWLLSIAHNKVRDLQRKLARQEVACGCGDDTDLLVHVPDEASVSRIWEDEWQDAIIRHCMEEVRRQVQPSTMKAFELVALKEWPAEKVATHLGISRNSVYLARNRVLARMRQLQEQLQDDW